MSKGFTQADESCFLKIDRGREGVGGLGGVQGVQQRGANKM